VNIALSKLSKSQKFVIPAKAGTQSFVDSKSTNGLGPGLSTEIPERGRRVDGFLGVPVLKRMALLLFAFAFSASVFAQTATPAMPPATPEIEARLKKLETELRCLVCQNQTLAESPAGLAGDLRREIRLLADSGKSNEEIKEFLRARYGDFVLYNPPMSGKTYLLWFGPFALLAGGATIAFLMARQRRQKLGVVHPSMSEAEQKRADALLKGDDGKK
jgi:cytochrome c-type biogenesis protein CcmH